MAVIKPFKAVRPTRDKACWVSCKALDSYSKDKLKSILEFNPYTFLHVVNPAYKYSDGGISEETLFKLVKNRYLEFKEDGILFQDTTPYLYIYKKITPKHQVYTGIVGAMSVEDYRNNIIKKHEETLAKREELFEYYLKNTGFNAEPVLLTYPDNTVIEQIISKYTETRAEYEFSTQDKNLHLLWIIDNQEDINLVQTAFKDINTLHIADGHHRTTASLLLADYLAERNLNHNGTEDYNFFMSYLLPESQINISSFNRFIKDLNGYTKETFLMELDTYFKIEKLGNNLYVPTKKQHFSMYLDGSFYELELRKSSDNKVLDSEILFDKILKGILGIGDIRYDERICYSSDIKAPLELKTRVDSGEFAVSFGMKPVSIEEIKEVTSQGRTLLPKTTYICPKIRSAMTIYEW